MNNSNTATHTGNVVRNTNEFSVDRAQVSFSSCGATLRGLLLRPREAVGALPAIVMAPGMSGVKEGSVLKYGEYFARGGFAVLVYDNINFGESDGEPRQEVDPQFQRRGYRDAITFVSSQPEVDKTRVGIWGSSYAGGHVLEIAAHDRRVKCVVSQIAHINGYAVFGRRVPPNLRQAALEAQDADREERFRGQPPAMIKAVSDIPNEFCAMSGAAAYEYFTEQAKTASNWQNRITLRSLDLTRGLDNGAFVKYISPTPLLMICAIEDELIPIDLSLETFAQALEPKKLVLIPGNHFSAYEQEFAITGNEARDWFTRHLVIGGSIALN
ncbi:alpha/beta hydrolase [Bradyrhizobium diazoefficiens]|uniref:alpha/beta hydrolase n=1 Tax=Bradyrhizobium diazoefficiens TaxID=1355477 RepID=UPI0004B2D4C5|nr:alpha/beta hydrolase [Bradyrhizobium diazoefficiens]